MVAYTIHILASLHLLASDGFPHFIVVVVMQTIAPCIVGPAKTSTCYPLVGKHPPPPIYPTDSLSPALIASCSKFEHKQKQTALRDWKCRVETLTHRPTRFPVDWKSKHVREKSFERTALSSKDDPDSAADYQHTAGRLQMWPSGPSVQQFFASGSSANTSVSNTGLETDFRRKAIESRFSGLQCAAVDLIRTVSRKGYIQRVVEEYNTGKASRKIMICSWNWEK